MPAILRLLGAAIATQSVASQQSANHSPVVFDNNAVMARIAFDSLIYAAKSGWISSPDSIATLSQNQSSDGNDIAGDSGASSSAGMPSPEDDNDSKLSKKAKNKLGNLENRSNEKVQDVLKSRGGSQSNLNELPTGSGQRLLGEVAEKAANGDKIANKIIKMVKQANKKGQRY